MAALYQVLGLERSDIAKIFDIKTPNKTNRIGNNVDRMLALLCLPDRRGNIKKRGPKPGVNLEIIQEIQKKVKDVMSLLVSQPSLKESA
jgi:hypothetical protein